VPSLLAISRQVSRNPAGPGSDRSCGVTADSFERLRLFCVDWLGYDACVSASNGGETPEAVPVTGCPTTFVGAGPDPAAPIGCIRVGSM
jgi:hypothetical protein